MNVDDLAQEIRRIDGSHRLGAGALAEALMPFLTRGFEYEFEVWQGDELLAGGVAATSHECGAESAHYAMMYGQDGPVTVRFYERREITETSHDPQ